MASMNDSSDISEEIRDEVDMTASMIPDEIGTISKSRTGMISTQSRAKAKHRVIADSDIIDEAVETVKESKIQQSMSKFTNSFIHEDSVFGLSMTGGGAIEKQARGAARPGDNDSSIAESSIQDEISVAGFGGSRKLQGRIVAKRDTSGQRKRVDDNDGPSAQERGWNYGEDEKEEDQLNEGQIHRLKRQLIANKTK